MKKLKCTFNLTFLTCFMLVSCSSIPEGASPVGNFDQPKYLGKWYEIARLDFKFEQNLNNTTAQYTLSNDGKTILVINKGYNYVTNKWEQALGKAKINNTKGQAMLKVSFWGPFYSPYNVLAIDTDYKYALVCGKNLDYLWILSRETSIPEDIKEKYLNMAKSIGFNISNLVWVEHNN